MAKKWVILLPMPLLRGLRISIRALAIALIFAGFFGFVGQALVTMGLFGPLLKTDWPVGDYAEAVRLPQGRFAIQIVGIRRIQIYSPEMRFQYGWPLQGPAGTLRSSQDGKLHIFKRIRGQFGQYHDWVYDINGILISENDLDGTSGLPGRPAEAVSVADSSPWWTLPLRSPPMSFALIPIGILMVIATTTRKDWENARRRRAGE
jgi:hypothetical protein